MYEIIGCHRVYSIKQCYGEYKDTELKECLCYLDELKRHFGNIIKFTFVHKPNNK